MTKTITVAGYFGDKRVSRDSFLKQWHDHHGELMTLCDSSADYEYYVKSRQVYGAMALRAFNRIWDKQNPPTLTDANY